MVKKKNKIKIMLLAASIGAANLSLAGPIRFLSSEEKKIQPKSAIKIQDNEAQEKQVADKVLVAPKSTPMMIRTDLHTHSIGLGIGQTFLTGNFEQNGDDSITFDLFYDYAASHSFDLFANLHYSNHSFLNREVSLPGVSLGIKGKFVHYDSFFPFVQGGFGFYRPTATRNVGGSLVKSKGKITFGVHLGAGGELKLNEKFKFGLLGSYHNPFDVKQDAGGDIEGSYFKLLLTGFYTFR